MHQVDMDAINTDDTKLSREIRWDKGTILIFVVAVIVFVSRIPFLGAGYGSDPDAWRVANTAQSIASVGEYSTSRFPGYPLPELLYSMVWRGGPFILNGITASLSVLGVVFFVLSLRILGCKDYILGGLALAFTPVVFVNSTNAMDYVWALAFILGSFYFVLVRKTLIAGILLGLAIGCRITSGAMLIPLSIVLTYQEKGLNITRQLEFSLASCLVGGGLFFPVILKYGWGFLTFFDRYPPLHEAFYLANVGVWGSLGAIVIRFVVASQLVCNKASRSIPTSTGKLLTVAWIVAICIYFVAFLRLPHDSGYLVPIVPFAIILLGQVIDRRLFMLLCIALVVSPFLLTIKSTGDLYISGPIFHDHYQRNYDIRLAQRVISVGGGLGQKSVIVSGPLLPHIQALIFLDSGSREMVDYVYLLTESDLQEYLDRCFKIYYLPGIKEYNLALYGVDLSSHGGILLVTDSE